MKELEKLKKKLKRAKWLYKHLNKVILGVGIPATVMGQCIAPFAPIVGVGFMLMALLMYAICGIIWLNRYQDSEYVNLLEKEIYYAEHASEHQIYLLDSAIVQQKNYLQRIVSERYQCRVSRDSWQIDKLTEEESRVSSLITDLIQIKRVTERVYREQQTQKAKEETNIDLKDMGI